MFLFPEENQESAVPPVSSTIHSTSYIKLLRDGQLLIVQNGVEYTIVGQKLR